MSEQPAFSAGIPEWDVADRMRKALRYAGVMPGQMAAYLEVGNNTVSTWINGRITPTPQTIRLFAMRCGVAYEWLRFGAPEFEPRPPDPGISAVQQEYEEMCRSTLTPWGTSVSPIPLTAGAAA